MRAQAKLRRKVRRAWARGSLRPVTATFSVPWEGRAVTVQASHDGLRGTRVHGVPDRHVSLRGSVKPVIVGWEGVMIGGLLVFVLFAVAWLMCAVTAAVIAKGKGRTAIGWLLLGLLFSIFAVVMVICLPAVDRGRQRQSLGYGRSEDE